MFDVYRIIVKWYLKIAKKYFLSKRYVSSHYCKKHKSRKIENFIIIYRISDSGYPKIKPPYINNENCLKNAICVFPIDKCKWIVIADNVGKPTLAMIKKYIPDDCIYEVSVGHGAGTFRIAYELALGYSSNSFVYFLENDYLHKKEAFHIITEAVTLNLSDYYTLYDNPDKYSYSLCSKNPFIINGGEKTNVILSKYTHWKYTNSTTMTFGAFVDVLKKDKNIFWRWTYKKHPYDFDIFVELSLFKNRKLISPLPSLSTHGETDYLALLINWYEVVTESNQKNL
jgi:hypothetical protein